MADNNTLRKDLGPVTAYAIAVQAGFEGTQEEWVRRISTSVDQQSFDTLAASVESGDTALSDKIDTEVEALSDGIDTEAETRAAADTNLSGQIDTLSETVTGKDTTLRNILVHKPVDPLSQDGTAGQVLTTHGDGTTEWTNAGQPTDAQATTAVEAWLTAHPEATTTVQDGAVSRAKLDAELQSRSDLVTNSLAPFFSQSVANGAGSYVIYGNKLYLLPNGHEVDVTWENTTKAEAKTTGEIKNLSDDVSGLKSALHSELHENTISNSSPFEIVAGYQINQTTGAFDEKSSWERSSYIDIEGGISIEVTTEYTLWNCAFYDASYAKLLFMSIYADTGAITIPTGAKYFAMSVASPRLTGVIITVTKGSFNAKIASEIATIRFEANNSLVDCPFSFVQGALNSTDGSIDSSSTRRIASNFIQILTEKMTVHVDNKYQSNVFFYSSETNGYLSNSGWTDGDYIIGDGITIPSGAKLIRITLRNKADTASNITPSTIQQGEFLIKYLAKKANEIELEKFEKLFVPSASPNIMYVCRDCRVRNDIPPNSKYAIKATAHNQYDRARFSVTKTTDGHYVAVHDVTINGLAVNSDGSAISTTINTADCSLAELNAYDWGLKYGAQYAGLKVPMLDDCLKLASIYNLGVVLDIKWTVTAEDIDALTVMLAKYGQTDAIFFAVNPPNAALFKAKNPRFSYLYAGTYEQMQTQTKNLAGLLTGYNHVYLANRPLGTAPTSDIINYACINNFDIMYSPIEGINQLIALGFDKGIALMECHYIENIKKSVMDYADSLVE